MPTNNILRALLLVGFVFIGYIGGYYVYKLVINRGDIKTYIFKEYKDGILKSGFACNCQKVGNSTSWMGTSPSTCFGGNFVKIQPINGTQPPPDTDACCQDRPRFKGKDLTGKSGLDCLK